MGVGYLQGFVCIFHRRCGEGGGGNGGGWDAGCLGGGVGARSLVLEMRCL